MPSIPEIRDRLGLAPAAAAWYDRWEAAAPTSEPMVVPSAADIERLLVDRIGADPVDARAAADARIDPVANPELWWVAQRCHQQLLDDMGGTSMLLWPQLPDSWGAAGRFTYLYALLAAIPHTLRYHREHGVDEAISWATFANISEKLRLNRARFGVPGLHVAFWFSLHMRGALYQLGRLEFATETLGTDHPFPGCDSGELTLGVHIPAAGGPLTADECRDSIARAESFFPTHFGDRFGARTTYTCTSWLLDPQLREFLSPDSNIARFQDLFTLVPAGPSATANGEKDVLLFAFNKVGTADPATLPRSTSLLRHLADGMVGGNRWQVRSGYFTR